MKPTATLVLFFASQVCLASLGPGFFTHTVKADTEEELIAKAERAMPLILKGKIKSPFQSQCWPNNHRTIEIDRLRVKKIYKVENNQILTPLYLGSIDYTHSRCRDR